MSNGDAHPFVVTNSSGASDLAEFLLNSSNPVQVRVEWQGYVLISRTISLKGWSNVSITGSNKAIVDGGGAVRLFEVRDGATLILTDVSLTGGEVINADDHGGAVFASNGSHVVARNCSFADNSAANTSNDGGECMILYKIQNQGSERSVHRYVLGIQEEHPGSFVTAICCS